MITTKNIIKLKDISFITNDDVFYKLRFLDQYMAEHKGFIAGGVFKNLFNNETIKDIDIFFQKEKDFKEAVELFKSKEGFKKYYSNAKVIAFRNKKKGIVIELIKSLFGTPEEVLSKFDFSITRFAYAKDDDDGTYYMMYVNTFFEDFVNKKLVIDGELIYPVSTFERSYRYRKYGYGLCKESKVKLIESLKSANTEDLSQDLYFGLD